MINFQKIIKYLAIAFAVFLIISITSGIIYGIANINYFINDREDNLKDVKIINIDTDIKSLKFDIQASSLIIKRDDTIKVETNNKKLDINDDNNVLVLKEKKNFIFNKNKSKIIVYLPDFVYDNVIIKLGAGELNIDNLSAKDVSLQIGAGKAVINKINTVNSLNIDSGAGKLDILDGNINNFDLDMGTGNVLVNGIITGNSRIDCGVGNIGIKLLDTSDNYELNISKGIGTITVDGDKIKDDITIGNGNNKIIIDGGIGEISINYSE